jgi:hypothetical protein
VVRASLAGVCASRRVVGVTLAVGSVRHGGLNLDLSSSTKIVRLRRMNENENKNFLFPFGSES